MSAPIIQGSGVRVEIGLTEGLPIPITAISRFNPGVATAVAHDLPFGSVGHFSDMVGMEELTGQAIRLLTAPSPADNFTLEDVNTLNFGVHVSGMFIPVLTWGLLAQSTQYALGGGAGKTEDVGTLIDTREVLLTTRNAAETVTIDIRSLKLDNAALRKIREVARQLGYLVFRLTIPGATAGTVGAERVFRGQPSLPGESVQQGGTGTGQLSVTIQGQICYLGAR